METNLVHYEPTPTASSVIEQKAEPESDLPDFAYDLEVMALTLAGECYDDKVEDKRLVCEVILNRVSDGRFGDSIVEVVTAPHQFEGYWQQSREVSENDYEVAEQAIRDWYANNCEALSDYLYFSAGADRENVFRTEF